MAFKNALSPFSNFVVIRYIFLLPTLNMVSLIIMVISNNYFTKKKLNRASLNFIKFEYICFLLKIPRSTKEVRIKTSDLPDPLFKIRSEPDLFFKLKSGRTRIRIFFKINIRPEPDPDLFFKLRSGRNRIRIFFSN